MKKKVDKRPFDNLPDDVFFDATSVPPPDMVESLVSRWPVNKDNKPFFGKVEFLPADDNKEDIEDPPGVYLSSVWLAEADDSLFDSEINAWPHDAEKTFRWEELEAQNSEIGSKEKNIDK